MTGSPIGLVENMGPEWTRQPVAVFNGTYDTHIKTGDDYDTLTLGELFHAEPAACPKLEGPAIVPSSYADYDAREHGVQRVRGQYVALTCDIDAGDHPGKRIKSHVESFAGDAAWLIYSSPHSRPGDRRWRVIIPLATPVPFEDWFDAQNALFNFMEFAGVPVDHALCRAAQPVFLPNVPDTHVKSGEALRGSDGKPLHYQRATTGTNAPGLSLDEGPVCVGMTQIRRKRAEDDAERERLRREAEKRRANRDTSGTGDIIADFGRSASIATLLESYGYTQSPRHPEDYRSPYQTGETYATRIMGDKWVSLSASDASAKIGATCSTGCYGDAYDLFVHFEHKGDHKAAFRQLHAERRAAQPWPEGMPEPVAIEYDPETGLPVLDDYGDYGDDEGEVVPVPLVDDPDTFPLLSLDDLENLPPPSWLVEELVSDNGLTILYGDPGAGKSFIMIDMALRLALGWDWHGAKTKHVGVLYIAGEGVRGLGKRVSGWRRRHNIDTKDLPFMLMPVAAQLLDPGERARLTRTIDAACLRAGFPIGLIIIDTVSRSIAGQDENGQETMSAFVKACDDIRLHSGGSVIGVHHSGKDKERGMRGSTVLLGACDATLKVSKAESLVTLKVEKQKDAEEAQPIYFEMERFAWPACDPENPDREETTLVPIRTEARQKAGVESLGRDQIRGAFIIMADAWADGAPLSHRPETRKDGRHAPTIFANRLGGDANVWAEALAHWLEHKAIAFEMYDKHLKRRGLQVLEPIS